MATKQYGTAAVDANHAATLGDEPWKNVAPIRRIDTGTTVTVTTDQPAFWAGGTQGTTIQATNWQVADFANKCRVLGGGALQASPNNSACAIMKVNGSDNVDPYELEFWYPGALICLHLVVFETDGTDIRVFVDDVPSTRTTFNIPSSGTWFLVIQNPSAFMKKIRVSMGRATFVQMVWSDPFLYPRPTLPKKMVAYTGDSYSVGNYISGGGNIFEGTWAHQLRAANIETIQLAQSGTGYINNGTANATVTTALGPANGSHFGSASRLTALQNQYLRGVRDLIVFGGANDSGGAANADIQAAAAQFFADIASTMPQMRVYVVGAQAAIYPSNNMNGVNAAVKAAAQAAPNVRLFIDQRAATPAWIVGTGKVGTPGGDGGNADRFISADGVHPSKAGAEWLGTLVLEALQTARTVAW